MAGWDGERHDNDHELEGDPAELGSGTHEAPFTSEQDEAEPALDLDEDERLPWLESIDDDEDDNGSETGRLIAFLIGGLVVLAALVGGIWWATHHGAKSELQADGSTIPAPAMPYKEEPKNPGGKTFAGTGDTSYAVSQGKTATPQLGGETPAPRPSIDLAPKAASTKAPAAAASAVPSGVGVQVAAYTSQASAEAGWTRLSQQYSNVLSGLKHRVVEGQADIGTVYRLQVVAGNATAAGALCDRLKAAGLSCQVKN